MLISFIEYKRALLNGLLTFKLQIGLAPSLINHQINEAMEFMELLTSPIANRKPLPASIVKYKRFGLQTESAALQELYHFLILSRVY